MRRSAFLLALVGATPLAARADTGSGGTCQTIEADLTPRANLQIVAWLEDASGAYVDTLYITQQVGRYGLGNRPGRFDFNSGPLWPYGRRITTFPVWAHRHGMSFPEIVFQDGNESDLSHSQAQSSHELHYCKPRLEHQEGWDTMTCATPSGVGAYSDKGKLGSATSQYPPRSDLSMMLGDLPSVDMYKMLDPFDAISQATPPGGVAAQLSWHVPPGLPAGTYTLWLEVAEETATDDPDHNDNATYGSATYPAPTLADFDNYGIPYRGQPSVVYNAAFTLGSASSSADSVDYVGYGDPDGLTGTLNPPDTTIDTAASRLQLVSDGSAMYRLRVKSQNQASSGPPAAPTEATAVSTTATTATVSFVAPADGELGKVTAYQIRYQAYVPITDGTFAGAMEVPGTVMPDDPGQVQKFDLPGLLPATPYSVGIRAVDACGNVGPLAITGFTTADRSYGSVDACFVATAAYGSVMANDVEMLRGFRDRVLQSTALGELAVETYYTFGPPMAQVVGSSELLRATARRALGPAVDLARTWRTP